MHSETVFSIRRAFVVIKMMNVAVLLAAVFVGAVLCEDDADEADRNHVSYSYSYSSKPVVTHAATYVPGGHYSVVHHVSSMAGGLPYGSVFNFRSSNYPGSMFRHRNWQVWLDPVSNADLYVKDSSFKIVRGLLEKVDAFFLMMVIVSPPGVQKISHINIKDILSAE